MTLSLLENRGCPLERQQFSWREMVQQPISKLNDDAYTRVHVILLGGIETQALRFSHACSRMNRELQGALAAIRRIEQYQSATVHGLIGADHSPLETSIAREQTEIDLGAGIALREPDPYLAQTFRFGLLEDLDHLYRFSALLDRLEGKDANNILQSYTDILPGRPTADQHRAAADDLRTAYDRTRAETLSKLHALTLAATAQQARDDYLRLGPAFADPLARQLYAEIAAVEEQHATQYETLIDPQETWLEKWLLHEANEVYNYYGCMQQERNPRVRALWERFLDYELGHFHVARELYETHERRDAAQVLSMFLPEPIPIASQRDFIRRVLAREIDLRTDGAHFVGPDAEGAASSACRQQLNGSGSPSTEAAAGYRWNPGTELTRLAS